MVNLAQSARRGATGVSFAARLTFDDIHHSFPGSRETLAGVSLDVPAGRVTCLLGPSGSGKTTLLRIAAGIETQSSGRVLLNGDEIAGPSVFLPPEKRAIGMVFQDFALFPHLSILDNVRFGLTALSRAESTGVAMQALARVGLESRARDWPHLLSGGEQQRVALARALAPRPAVLLMDEPFSGLDSRLKDSVRAETLAMLRENRATAVIVTHDAEEAMRMADNIALLRDGRLVQSGTTHEIYNRPADLFAASFFSEVNLFAAQVRDGHARSPLGLHKAAGIAEGAPVDIAVRLQAIEPSDRPDAAPARILSRRFLGVIELIELALPDTERPVLVRARIGLFPDNGPDLRVAARDSDVLVFEKRAANA